VRRLGWESSPECGSPAQTQLVSRSNAWTPDT
jgi:hypothetical protein